MKAFFLEQFFAFSWQDCLGNFGEICFSSVIWTNFAIFWAKFAKILTSQIWKKYYRGNSLKFCGFCFWFGFFFLIIAVVGIVLLFSFQKQTNLHYIYFFGVLGCESCSWVLFLTLVYLFSHKWRFFFSSHVFLFFFFNWIPSPSSLFLLVVIALLVS